MNNFKVNPRLSYKFKKGVYAIYINHNLFFLKNNLAYFFKNILDNNFSEIPTEFLSYLLKKEIILKD